jgi:type IV pilus assembly protein PilM
VSVLTDPLPRLRIPSPTRLRMPSRASASTVTGLEIDAVRAVAVQARVHDGRVVAERAAAHPLPPGLVRDGAVIDPDGLGRELKRLFAEHRLGKRVRVGLATPRTILRVVDLPPLEERDIEAALRMQAHEHIPMPLDRAVMDFQPIGIVETPAGRRARVVVVVSERDRIELLLTALRRAGLRPVGVDLSIFALIRALHDAARPADEPVLYAHLGELANVAIAEAGVCRFTRLAPPGFATLVERLAEHAQIPREEALALLERPALADAPEASGVHDAAVHDVVRRTALELGSELRNAAEFYAAQFASKPVAAGVVAGPLVAVPGFVEALGDASGLELARGEVPLARPDALGPLDAGLVPLAAGLAVWEVAP